MSIIVALEQSTPRSSLAIARDGELLLEADWRDERGRNQQLFERLPAALSACDLDLAQVDRYAVGLGPGGFTALRIAVSAARGYALPRGLPVQGVASDAALAARIGRASGNDRIAIVGDARRKRIWVAGFENCRATPVLSEERALVPEAHVLEALRGVDLVCTPDWDRIAAPLAGAPGLREEIMAPTAADVAVLAFASEDSLPLTPIYLHPPVFIEPRFPA